MVPTFNFLNLGTVPTFNILNVGTVPTFNILNVGTVPTFKGPLSLIFEDNLTSGCWDIQI